MNVIDEGVGITARTAMLVTAKVLCTLYCAAVGRAASPSLVDFIDPTPPSSSSPSLFLSCSVPFAPFFHSQNRLSLLFGHTPSFIPVPFCIFSSRIFHLSPHPPSAAHPPQLPSSLSVLPLLHPRSAFEGSFSPRVGGEHLSLRPLSPRLPSFRALAGVAAYATRRVVHSPSLIQGV